MRLFRCCRSDEAIDKDAHTRPKNARAKRDEFDEDLKAVKWMRERANERSHEMYNKEIINEGEKDAKELSVDCSIVLGDNSVSSEPDTPLTTAEQILEDLQSDYFNFITNKAENESIGVVDSARRSQKHEGLSQSTKRKQSKISPCNTADTKNSFQYSHKLGEDRSCNFDENDKNKSKENIQNSIKVSFDSSSCVEISYDKESSIAEQITAIKESINRLLIEKQNSILKTDKEILLKLVSSTQNEDFDFETWKSETEVIMKQITSKYDLKDNSFLTDSSRKHNRSGLSIDILVATSSVSGEGIEATLDGKIPNESAKKSKIEHKLEPDTDIVDLISEDECDDLKDSIFPILGADSVSKRLLKVRLMEALRGFLPYAIAEQNFWLKFSLERDGSSLKTLLHKVRGSKPCLIIIQAVGERSNLFGSFTSSEWKCQPHWFGTGQAFLFKKSSSLEVYPYTGSDDMVQYCSSKMIAIGGGDWKVKSPYGKREENGIGLLIDGDLEGGESHSCATFCNPGLSSKKEFSIVNMEVWTLTPCSTEAEAENLEKHKLFVEENIR
jgi:hypothetical protein